MDSIQGRLNEALPVMPDWLSRQASVLPDHLAVCAEEGQLTYRELFHRAMCTADQLQENGVGPGMHIAVLMKSGFWFVQTVHALIQAEAVLVPINWRLTKAEMLFQMEDASVTHILYDGPFAQMAKDIADHTRRPVRILNVTDLVAQADKRSVVERHTTIDLGAVQGVVYTSGTTGFPKGAQVTYRNHLFNTFGVGIQFGLRSSDKWLVPMPLFHVGGLAVLMRSVIYGLTLVIHSTFSASDVNRALDDDGISIVSIVPTMLSRMLSLREGEKYPDSLRVVFLGGSPTPPQLLEQALALEVPIFQSYGLTESDSTVCILDVAEARQKFGSVGKPLLASEVSIWNHDKIIAEPNVEGEIIIRGPTVISGYLNRADANETLFVDGWLHTGDMGYLDDTGYLYVLDRRSDLIVSGGENIYPTEIEAVLLAHPNVEAVGVVGRADLEWGQVPVAFVQMRPGTHASEAELRCYCYDKLAKYKIPVAFHEMNPLPRNASGKLLRKSLRACLTK